MIRAIQLNGSLCHWQMLQTISNQIMQFRKKIFTKKHKHSIKLKNYENFVLNFASRHTSLNMLHKDGMRREIIFFSFHIPIIKSETKIKSLNSHSLLREECESDEIKWCCFASQWTCESLRIFSFEWQIKS